MNNNDEYIDHGNIDKANEFLKIMGIDSTIKQPEKLEIKNTTDEKKVEHTTTK